MPIGIKIGGRQYLRRQEDDLFYDGPGHYNHTIKFGESDAEGNAEITMQFNEFRK